MVDSEKSPGTTAYGVLILRLSAGGYAWKFLPVAGQSFTDSGTGQCHQEAFLALFTQPPRRGYLRTSEKFARRNSYLAYKKYRI